MKENEPLARSGIIFYGKLKEPRETIPGRKRKKRGFNQQK